LDLNKRSKFFYTSILLIIVQLAAKAKSLKLEPLNEKLFVLLKKFDKNWLDEILKISLEKANPFAKMGDIDVILATKNEILSLRDELNK
jgi:phosphoribosyl-dephospho-CoA transferase